MQQLEPAQPARTVNPQAGSHLITADPDALAACEAAIARSYAEHPYLQQRYGDRGRRFSSSDSGWLITVTDLGREGTLDQVLWLGRVLAARGMPRLIMEEHLGYLAEELGARRPADRTTRCALLRVASDELRAKRERAIDPAEAAEITAAFASRVDPAELAALPSTARLLVAAVADEADGLPGAVDSLVEWLADGERFNPTWIEAVRATVQEARTHLA
ncbi:MAG: hypothetical protein IPI32_02825 [Austwickia sp.]|jgi:hypothetical protein|nr:hypothetical protein [Austwickia sp.]MBK8437893.1 hypothetical protein [Austwickia sp.]MBK9100194.1 hypothetical protein [Austwickia sp.]